VMSYIPVYTHAQPTLDLHRRVEISPGRVDAVILDRYDGHRLRVGVGAGVSVGGKR